MSKSVMSIPFNFKCFLVFSTIVLQYTCTIHKRHATPNSIFSGSTVHTSLSSPLFSYMNSVGFLLTRLISNPLQTSVNYLYLITYSMKMKKS